MFVGVGWGNVGASFKNEFKNFMTVPFQPIQTFSLNSLVFDLPSNKAIIYMTTLICL